MFPTDLTDRAAALIALCKQQGLMVATAESCTGGLIIGCLTEVAGSSAVVDRGFITYSNEAKMDLVDVPKDLLIQHGAVSEPVARAMAQGALANSQASISMAVTGVAGPGGGSEAKPVGLVHIAAARADGQVLHVEMRYGDIGRDQVRQKTIRSALDLAAELF